MKNFLMSLLLLAIMYVIAFLLSLVTGGDFGEPPTQIEIQNYDYQSRQSP